jgi:hypothetical protein
MFSWLRRKPPADEDTHPSVESAWWTKISVPMPNLRFVLGTIVVLFTIYGISLGICAIFGTCLSKPQNYVPYENAAYFVGVVGISIVKGLILAAIVWLLAWGLGRFRVRNPKTFVLWIGNIVYWVGSAIAIYLAGLAVYATIYFVWASNNSQGAASAISLLIVAPFFYWFLARGIRYMLGR